MTCAQRVNLGGPWLGVKRERRNLWWSYVLWADVLTVRFLTLISSVAQVDMGVTGPAS